MSTFENSTDDLTRVERKAQERKPLSVVNAKGERLLTAAMPDPQQERSAFKVNKLKEVWKKRRLLARPHKLHK